MNIDQFWDIIERVHVSSGGDMKRKCGLLAEDLRKLPASEVRSFGEYFGDCYSRLYSWEVWGAAFVINDGCGDDSFMDFRSTLISLGRTPFEAAVVDPDSLAGFNIDPQWSTFEGYQYVVGKVYKEMNGDEISHRKGHPQKPSGVPFKEWAMSKRYPRLVAKHGYKDSAWMYLKEQQEKAAKEKETAHRLASLLLDSGIIPSCGLVPSFRIVARVLRTGRSPEATGRKLTWEPFELQEGNYWSTVLHLEKLTTDDLKNRPDLHMTKITQDLTSVKNDDFDLWIQTLIDRGLA